MADYFTLIDASTWDFIRATEAAYPPDTARLSIAEQRAIHDGMCRRFFQGYPGEVTARDESIGGVTCRNYPGGQPVVVYLHGGGLVVGGLDSHDDVCAEIRATTGLTVISVDYRLLPEHPSPAALADTLTVTRHAAAQGPVLLAGDSAAGYLAASAAQVLRGDPSSRVLGQVLIYPGLGGDLDRGSAMIHAQAPMLTRDDVIQYRDLQREPTDSTIPPMPLDIGDFSGLPPTVTFGAECDPLCDDARDYAAAIRSAGGKGHFILEPDLVHGYLGARTTVPRAKASFTRITQAIAALARGDWPHGATS